MFRNKITVPVIFILLLQALLSYGQTNKIEVPHLNDRYSKYVQQLESGHTDIDYADFRNSFLESKQFDKKGRVYDSLKRQVYAEIEKDNYQAIISLTKAMLNIDYTSMFAHMYLQKTYKILGDTVNRNKYHDIEFGLLNSIMKSGDGKTCETGWHVTQIEEEYFIIDVMGADFNGQSIAQSKSHICDKMDVKTEEGKDKTYYFEANKVFEMEEKMFGGKK